MSVIQRCPNCGTTQASPGECQACQEAQVRYFCTNHSPGLWLEATTCPKCGAHFGDPPRRAATPAPASPPRTRSPASARSAVRTSVTPPDSRSALPRAASAWGSRKPMPSVHEPELDAGATPAPLWQQLLRAAIRARTRPPPGLPDRSSLLPARAAVGCVMRLLLAVVFAIVALVAAIFLFGRAMLD